MGLVLNISEHVNIFFLNQKHDASRCCFSCFQNNSTWILPLASLDGWKQTLSKPRFISSFLPFTCGPPILPTPESNPCGELELPFVISKVCESQSLSDLHGSSWYISEQRSSGIGENPTIFITDRTKSPRVGKTARWSMLPR